MPNIASSILASLLAGLVFGAYAGYQYSQGQQAIESNIEQRATEAANKATASAIAAIEIKNTTIYHKVQNNVKKDPVYRSASCVHSADVMRNIESAFE